MPDVRAALKMVFPTNLVAFRFRGEKDPVLTSIQAIHSRTKVGTTTGTVIAVDADAKMPSIDVKPSSRGHTERYVPHWDAAAKGWDKQLVQIIAGLSAGDKITVAWTYDERKRATDIEVIEKGKGTSSSAKGRD